jgi:3-hydroxybutyrate dehydrogenase
MSKKVAVITGAASGIGLAVSRSMARAGYAVVMADINEAAGAAEAKAAGAFFVKTDLSKPADCRRLIELAAAHFGSVDILVNNAGIQHVCPVDEFPEEKWNLILGLMLTAPFLLIKNAWPFMKKNRWGRIININSVHGLRASEFKAAYVSAKHGLTGLTKTCAIEGAPVGITVNDICPGYVRTPLVDGQIDAQAQTHGISREAVVEQVLLKKQALKQLVEPEELADAVLYLCSAAARCLTGVALTIDCGWTAQ